MSSPNPSPVVIGPTWRRGPDGKFVLPERTLGWDVLAWTAEYLRQPDGPDAGKPWRYTPEQARFILHWYAVDEYGRFVYRYGMLRRVKGWGLPARTRLARRSARSSSLARAGSLVGTPAGSRCPCRIRRRGC